MDATKRPEPAHVCPKGDIVQCNLRWGELAAFEDYIIARRARTVLGALTAKRLFDIVARKREIVCRSSVCRVVRHH